MILIKKSYKIVIITFFALIFTVAFTFPIFFLPSNTKFTNIKIELRFNGDEAYNYVADQININLTSYRIPGTQGREECAEYFRSKFQQIDSGFNFTFHNFTVLSVGCQNVLFKMNENFSNILILGTHYDSRAKATKDSSNPTLPVPGANDGASGSAVLIELAKALYQRKQELSVQIWFLFFDAEDQGTDNAPGISGWDWCEGSNKFIQDIKHFYNSSEESFDAMILLDMVGGTNLRFISEQYSTSSLLNELFETGQQLGFTSAFPSNPTVGTITDDHVAFINYGVPSADLIIKFWNAPIEWPYHHTTEDDLTHISNHSLEITGKTVEQFIYNNYYDLDNNPFQGNYPWSNDLNFLDTDILIIIIILISSVGIIVTISYLYFRVKKKNS